MHLTSALKLPTCNFDLLSKVYVSLELFSPCYLGLWNKTSARRLKIVI